MNLSGIPLIDAQHEKLLDTLLKLRMWSDLGREYAASMNAIQELADYVEVHFADEVRMLKEAGFPIEEQVAQHDCMRNVVKMLIDEFIQGEARTKEIMEILQDWLTNHIDIEAVEFQHSPLLDKYKK